MGKRRAELEAEIAEINRTMAPVRCTLRDDGMVEVELIDDLRYFKRAMETLPGISKAEADAMVAGLQREFKKLEGGGG